MVVFFQPTVFILLVIDENLLLVDTILNNYTLPSTLHHNKVLTLQPFAIHKNQTHLFPFAYTSKQMRLFVHCFIWLFSSALAFWFFSALLNGQPWARTPINLFFLLLCHYCCRYFVEFFFDKKKFVLFVVSVLLFVTVFVFPRTFIELYFLKGPAVRTISYEEAGLHFGKIYGFLYCVGLLFALVSCLYVIVKNRRTLEIDLQVMEDKHAEAQLNFLKAQLNPHFLFNTLNNIYSASVLQNPKTPEMIMKLSELLRYVTYEARKEKVKLEDEIEQIENYIELFQLKSPKRLNIHFIKKLNNNHCFIEPLLLLHFVENALKHSNIMNDDEDSFIEIELLVNDKQIEFSLCNSFDEGDTTIKKIGGVGNKNIKERLELLYPNNFYLNTIVEDEVYKSVLKLNI